MPLLLIYIAAVIFICAFIASATKGEIDLTNYLKHFEDEKNHTSQS